MFNSRIVSLITVISLVIFLTGYSQQSNETKTVLVLFGDTPGTPANKPILDGIRLKLYEAYGDSYNLHVEYLDMARYSDGIYPREKFSLLNKKYKDLKLDLLICIDRNSIKPLKDYAESYLLNLPTISFDLDFTNYGFPTDLRINEKTVCIGLKFNIEKTITTALDFFPKTSSIYFISGVSAFDKLILQISLQAAKIIDGERKVEVLTDLSMDEIITKVHKIPENSIIFVPVFTTDSKSVPYYNPEAVNLISRESNVPVFVLSDMGMDNGAFGGYVLSFKKAGLFTGKVAVDILNGKDLNSISVNEDDYYEYVFDWRELKRWHLQNSEFIPEGSTILSEEIIPLEKFKWIIGAVILFLVLQSLLIANLIRLNRKQKLLNQKIIETENKYRGFLHEDRALRLGQIAASLSHELNQPLTAILSTAQAGINFINSNEANNELLKQILQKIVDNDKRTASILHSLRGMLQPQNREKETTNLNECITEIVEIYQSEANIQNLTITLKLTDEPIYIFADKIQIQQVILNLVTNGAQVMKKMKTEKQMLDITQIIENGNVIISVRDFGEGVAESIIDKIFKPFVTSRVEGSGIGLAICKSIIEDHNGKIWVENLHSAGAKFLFSLPVVKNG